MSYQLQTRQKSSRKRVLGIALGIVIVVLGIYYIFPSFFTHVTLSVSKPITKSKDAVVSVFSKSELFHTKANLIDENTRLHKKNQDLIEKLISFDIVISQNDEFRKFLGIRSKLSGTVVPVTMHPSESPYDILVISLSKDNTAKVGDMVTYGSVALGTVTEIAGLNAKTTLYTSPGIITEGRIMKNGTPLQIKGVGGGNFVYSAPRELDIAIGDLITLSSNPDFALARVADIEETDSDSFKKIRLTNLTNIFSLKFVEIIYGQ